MLVGPWVDAASVAIGGAVGAALGLRLPERLRTAMPLTFGAASMGMGVALIVKVAHIPVMVLALVLGAIIGELIYLERGIGNAAKVVQGLMHRLVPSQVEAGDQKDFLTQFVAIVVLFCASGTGIFGALHEGMTGDSSILIAKSFLDLFTSAIFAATLGYTVVTIAIPQLVILLALGYGAIYIVPHTTVPMNNDFSAVGGVLMLATGMRICGIKSFPVANMLPGIVLAMPLSYLWTRYM